MRVSYPKAALIGLTVRAVFGAQTVFAQQLPPVRTLSGPIAVSASTFAGPSVVGATVQVAPLPGGRIVVSDPTDRRLVLLDSTLGGRVQLLDSLPFGSPHSFVMAYGADSALFLNDRDKSLTVIGPSGAFGRVMRAPPYAGITMMQADRMGVSSMFGLVFKKRAPTSAMLQGARAGGPRQGVVDDSMIIVRTTPGSRTVDTIARFTRVGARDST